jgi:hypothetical protein
VLTFLEFSSYNISKTPKTKEVLQQPKNFSEKACYNARG